MTATVTAVPSDETVVVYSVRDLFERVDGKLDGLDRKLDAKADRADLDAVRLEVAAVKGEVSEFRLWRAKVIGFAFGVSVIGGGSGAAILRSVLGG